MQWTRTTENWYEALLAGQAHTDALALQAVANAEAAATTAQASAEAALTASKLFHGYERWFAAALVPNGEIHVADRVGTSTVAFQVDGGGGAGGSWGTWLQVLGSSDTPAIVDMVTYNVFGMVVTAVERAGTFYLIQAACGTSAAGALAAGTYSEFVFRSGAALTGELPFGFQMRRQAVGTKMWVRAWAVAFDTGTLDFVLGLREYDV